MSILTILALIIFGPSLLALLFVLAIAWDNWLNGGVREAEAAIYAREKIRRMKPQPVEELQVERHEAIEQHRRSPMLSRIEAELQQQHFPEKVLAREALKHANRFTN